MDSLEWLSRYAEFYSSESVSMFLATFRDIYIGTDIPYRNAYINE